MNKEQSNADMRHDRKNWGHVPKLRDDITEGYNIIPNFFISARLNQALNYDDKIDLADTEQNHFINKHFENRLFDRDTLLVCHYDVNFLFVISLYAQNNSIQKRMWKEKVRAIFRAETQRVLQEQYDFYILTAQPGEDVLAYLQQHFRQTLGKIFAPYNKDYFLLALDKEDPEKDNNTLLCELRKHFVVKKHTFSDLTHTRRNPTL
jgi:hypothetical protein